MSEEPHNEISEPTEGDQTSYSSSEESPSDTPAPHHWLMNPENFYLSQMGFAALVLILGYRAVFGGKQKSRFKQTEAERLSALKSSLAQKKTRSPDHRSLADAKMKQRPRPLQIGGIVLDAPAHELLGVTIQASASEVQKAYREKMKQYHPDKVGRPGSREWTDAMKIAEALNRARDELLKKAEK